MSWRANEVSSRSGNALRELEEGKAGQNIDKVCLIIRL